MLRSVSRTLGSKAENHRTIAIVTPYFLPVSAGIEVYVAELSRRLKDEYRVIIYAAGRTDVHRYEDMEVKRYRSFDYQKLPVRHKVAYPFPFAMLRDLTNDQIDLINAHGHDFFTSYLAALAARRRKIPFVLRKLDAKFMVVGNGPLKKELEMLAERLAISDHLTFLWRNKS